MSEKHTVDLSTSEFNVEPALIGVCAQIAARSNMEYYGSELHDLAKDYLKAVLQDCLRKRRAQ